MIEPVRWRSGRLEILDQRRLPDRRRILRLSTVDQVVRAIRSLAVRGAPLIGIAAGYGMCLGRDRLVDAVKLMDSRPTAVNLPWAVQRVLAARDMLAEARKLHAEEIRRCAAIARHGAPLVRKGPALTICNTGVLATGGVGTAFGILLRARAKVYALETRPLCQGARLTMWEARENGLDATLVVDGAAAATMVAKGIRAVVVGADRIARNGDFANKIGTLGVALAARELSVPFYVAAPTSTVDLSLRSGLGIPVEERDPREVSRRFPAYNPAFDVTPAAFVTAFITERGILKPAAIRSCK